MHIAQWGVVFTTPQITENSAKATVSVSVNNNSSSSKNVTVDCRLIDPSGKISASKKQEIEISANDKKELELYLDVAKPQLWSVDNPNLYRLKVAVYSGKKLTDEWSDEVGIRSIRFDSDKGFFLNGKPLKILGVCDHHDLGALGAAVNTRAIERQLEEHRGDAEQFPSECIILDDPAWHRGVLGILASRVVDRTGRPALVLTHEDGQAHGSGRSPACAGYV